MTPLTPQQLEALIGRYFACRALLVEDEHLKKDRTYQCAVDLLDISRQLLFAEATGELARLLKDG